MAPSSAEPEVELRVEDALKKIERAQNDLAAACADLSAIIGAVPLWKRASSLSDACHKFWWSLRNRDRRRWRLDGMGRTL